MNKTIKVPYVDLGECSFCEGCIEVSPSVFMLNQDTGNIEVAELDEYPVVEVDEAIMYCPEDCIHWEDIQL